MMPEIKYLPGAQVCFIQGETIIMAKVNLTFYDTKSKTFKFLLGKFAKEFTEDELFFSFSEANEFLEKGSA